VGLQEMKMKDLPREIFSNLLVGSNIALYGYDNLALYIMRKKYSEMLLTVNHSLIQSFF
jgi:hypothetical protein